MKIPVFDTGAGLMELFELEQAGLEVLFEGGERGGGHGLN